MPVEAEAPAAHLAVVEDRAGVVLGGGDRDGSPAQADGRIEPGVSLSPIVSSLPYPSATDRADAPAANLAVVEDHAGVPAAGGDRLRTPIRPQEHRPHRGRSLVVADRVRVPVPELAERAAAPAANLAVVEDHARVVLAGCDRARGPSRPEIHRADRSRQLVVADVVGRPVAEPAVPALAPAAHAAVVEDDARVPLAECDRPRTPAGAERDEAHGARQLVVSDRVRVAVPELARGAQPQQRRRPLVRIAHVWYPPASTTPAW